MRGNAAGMAREGYEIPVNDAVEIRVRRCFGDEAGEPEVVELTAETFKDGWFLSSLCLTPAQALDVAHALSQEAIAPLVPWSARPTSKEDFRG